MISPGWQSKYLQIASSVEKRIALTLPVLRLDILALVIPTASASSVTDTRLFAITSSRWRIIVTAITQPTMWRLVLLVDAALGQKRKRAAKQNKR